MIVPRKIIDIHQHLNGPNTADVLAETYERLGVVKAVLLGQPPRYRPGVNEAVLAAHKEFPDLFIPFVGFDLDEWKPDELKRFHDEGYVGIKFIGPRKAYNDPSYFPVYEKASELKMPGVFHLGIIANAGPWTVCDSNLMRAIHLDHIARNFPEMTVIGAHLGNPWYDEATMACRWNPNLFFDLSGSTLKKKTPEFLSSLLWWTPDSVPYLSPDRTCAWQKICFGSDVAHDFVEDVINDYENLMSALDLKPEFRDAIWYGTAAKILGFNE